MQPLPGPGPRLRVSANGGSEPVWARDGSAVYFRSVGGVTRADLNTTRTAVVRSQILFADTFDRTSNGENGWDLLASGELLFQRAPVASGRLHAVPDWHALYDRARALSAAPR